MNAETTDTREQVAIAVSRLVTNDPSNAVSGLGKSSVCCSIHLGQLTLSQLAR